MISSTPSTGQIAPRTADPKRVAIFGRSYGGYAAHAGLTFTPDKFACAVEMRGISNLVTMMKNSPAVLEGVADDLEGADG